MFTTSNRFCETLVVADSAIVGTHSANLFLAGFAQTTGVVQKFYGPPDMYGKAREYCHRAQNLMLQPYMENCRNCKLTISCLCYIDVRAFSGVLP